MVTRSRHSIPCEDCGVVRVFTSKHSKKTREQPYCRSCGAKRRWRERHGEPKTPAEIRQLSRDYNERNRAKLTLHYARQRDALRAEMVAAYGGSCAHCFEADPAVLVLDHIHNDGATERREGRWGDPFVKQLKRAGWPKERLQLLCHNCNARKEMKRRREQLLLKINGGSNS